MKYLATFFSHFGATRFSRELQNNKIECKLMPVPRLVSSSCGTCVLYEYEKMYISEKLPDYVDKIFSIENNDKYVLQYEIEDR